MRKVIKINQVIDLDNNKIISDDKVEDIVYLYSELPTTKAKEVAEEIMLDDKISNTITQINFEDYVDNYLYELFPNSDLQYQYSLSYCQGDGFNIYGELNLYDILDKIKDKLTEGEIKYINWLASIENSVKLKMNRRYNYCICDREEMLQNITAYLELNCYKNVRYDIIIKFEKLAGKYLKDLCDNLEDKGYEHIYNLTENDIECYEYNGMSFNEDGSLYGYINFN